MDVAVRLVYWHLKLSDEYILRVGPVFGGVARKLDSQVQALQGFFAALQEKVAETDQRDVALVISTGVLASGVCMFLNYRHGCKHMIAELKKKWQKEREEKDSLKSERDELLQKLGNCEPGVVQQILELQTDEAQWHSRQAREAMTALEAEVEEIRSMYDDEVARRKHLENTLQRHESRMQHFLTQATPPRTTNCDVAGVMEAGELLFASNGSACTEVGGQEAVMECNDRGDSPAQEQSKDGQGSDQEQRQQQQQQEKDDQQEQEKDDKQEQEEHLEQDQDQEQEQDLNQEQEQNQDQDQEQGYEQEQGHTDRDEDAKAITTNNMDAKTRSTTSYTVQDLDLSKMKELIGRLDNNASHTPKNNGDASTQPLPSLPSSLPLQPPHTFSPVPKSPLVSTNPRSTTPKAASFKRNTLLTPSPYGKQQRVPKMSPTVAEETTGLAKKREGVEFTASVGGLNLDGDGSELEVEEKTEKGQAKSGNKQDGEEKQEEIQGRQKQQKNEQQQKQHQQKQSQKRQETDSLPARPSTIPRPKRQAPKRPLHPLDFSQILGMSLWMNEGAQAATPPASVTSASSWDGEHDDEEDFMTRVGANAEADWKYHF